MSFLDYLNDHRGQFIDHRIVPPSGPRTSSDEARLDVADELDDVTGSAWPGRRRRTRGTARGDRGVRFRQLRPLHAPLPYSDPLPYEEPWERAFR